MCRTFNPLPRGFLATSTRSRITSHFEHGYAIKSDATLWCWGEAASGRLGHGSTAPPQLTPIPAQLTDVAQVDAGIHQTCAVTHDGAAWSWRLLL